jgi:uncharacterized low-complexity protein
MSRISKLNALAAGVVIGTLGAGAAQAAANPFAATDLPGGYMQLAEHGEGKCGEGKCGEGKCGEKKDGKTEEGKCGEKKGDAEGKCGEKKAEGKCGEKK